MKILDDAKARLHDARAAHPVVDHAARAYKRHSEVLGGQVAGAVTYFGFLAFFPVLALAFAVVGYVSIVYPGARDGITSAVQGAFPSLIGSGSSQINIDDVVSAKAGAGLIGLVGLLYAGLGWLDALRDGLRRVFGTLDEPLSFLRKKLTDLLVLVLLGVALIASVAVSTLATNATAAVLGVVGLAHSLTATLLLKVLAVVLALAVDWAVFAILLSRLPGGHVPWRNVRSGALIAAVGFEVLKLLGTFLIAKTTHNPLYATFGVIVGLLVWINFVSRLLVYAAAWTATQASGSVRVAAPPDYEPVRVGVVDSASSAPRKGRTLTVRGAIVGAAVGAGLAELSRRTRRG